MKQLSFVSRIALLLGFFFTLDKALAIVRGIIILRQFQLSATLDSFYFADLLPSWEVAVFSGSALALAMIPVLSQTLTLQGRRAMWDAFSRIANLAFLVTGAAAVLAAIFAEPLIHYWIAPGISPAQQQFTAGLMRIDLIATFIFSLSGLVIAALQANQHFLMPAVAPILYNIGQIFGAAILAPSQPYALGPIHVPVFGFGVYGLVYGIIIGAALHLAIQIPALIHYGFRWTPSLNVRQPALIEMFKVLWPRLLTALGVQLMFSMRANLASRLSAGAFSAISNGWTIMQVPETLLGTAIATAMLPTLSEFAARADWDAFHQTVERAVRVLVALTLPAGAIIAAGIHPLLRAVFHLDQASTDLLTLTARAYMLTLCGYALQEVAARAFYARKEAMLPLATIVLRLIVYLAIGISGVVLFRSVGAPVIALGELALTAEAAVMLLVLKGRLRDPLRMDGAVLRGLAAALLGGLTAYVLALKLPGSAVITAIAGMAAGTVVALLIVSRELRLFLKLGGDGKEKAQDNAKSLSGN